MSVRLLSLSALLFAAACSGPSTQASSGAGIRATFDEVEAGALPSGYSAASGRWSVVDDPSAPSGARALAQLACDGSAGFNVILVDDSSFEDVDLSVSFRSIAGEVDQGGGPVWRARDGESYYIARYNPLEDNYRVYVVVDGRRRQLGSAEIAPTPGWHELRVTMVGDLIRCYYDGGQALEVRDTTFAGAGQVGLWTKADAQTHFDDLRVN